MQISPKAFAESLGLKLVGPALGEEMPSIRVAEINRPGLQFAGYFDVFASERPQLVGLAEMAYLNSLDEETALCRLKAFFSYPIPCVIVSRGMDCPLALLDAAGQAGVPVYVTKERTSAFESKAVFYLSEVFAPRITEHGVLMDVYGQGILIRGESGIGKSECALELLNHGHQLIADDVVEIIRIGKELFGEAPETIRDLMELRGVGIVDIKKIFGIGAVEHRKHIDLVIHIDHWSREKQYDRLGSGEEKIEILGVSLPFVEIPVRPGRSLATIVEIAARSWSLKTEGYYAADELDRRLRERYLSDSFSFGTDGE
ncbi:MAG: HPr(Ser) kinase/phosphatase [Clostridiales bacterium]|nr:HPr(Ser) kinase/phosphatase [Clostridiales bacterium]